MIEYLGESRIDGYPIVKLPKNFEGDLFSEYFRNLKDKFGYPIEVNIVKQLDDQYDSENNIVKVTLTPTKFKKELLIFTRKVLNITGGGRSKV